MNGRTAKALRKVFKAKDNPENFKEFKRALNHADPETRKKTLQMARDIVKSGKPIHHGRIPDGRN